MTFLMVILAAILLPALNSARLRGQQASSVSNLKQIGTALEFYSQCSRGQLRPHGIMADGRNAQTEPAAVWEALRSQGHLADSKVFVAPFDKKSTAAFYGQKITPANTSYAYIYVSPQYSSASATAFEKPWSIPAKSDRISVLYADGHVESHTVPGVSEMSCRELLLKHPDIFGLHYNENDPMPTDPEDEYHFGKDYRNR